MTTSRQEAIKAIVDALDCEELQGIEDSIEYMYATGTVIGEAVNQLLTQMGMDGVDKGVDEYDALLDGIAGV